MNCGSGWLEELLSGLAFREELNCMAKLSYAAKLTLLRNTADIL